MHFFLCPDKFKGSATAEQVIEAITLGLEAILTEENLKITASPLSDGGEGFASIAASQRQGTWIKTETVNALHEPIEASYFLSEEVAYIDMASANGLAQIPVEKRNPLNSSTYGTGLLIKHATEVSKAKKIYIGLGGSATNDGGAGMAAALGATFLDDQQQKLQPTPAELIHCREIKLDQLLKTPPIIAACDVNNPLLGKNGATYTYGPQKGITNCADLDAILENLMHLGKGENNATIPGAGAAGGIAYGLLHYCNARLESGFDIIASIIELEKNIEQADIIITGEGSLDSQTLNGKGPQGVANLAKKHNKPILAIAGKAESCVLPYFDHVYTLSSLDVPLEVCLREAPSLITRLSSKLALEFKQKT